jgi:hypothetical protein
MLKHDAVHRLPLIVAKLQPVYQLGVVPPTSAATRRSERLLHWRPVVSKTWPPTVVTAESLGAGCSRNQ